MPSTRFFALFKTSVKEILGYKPSRKTLKPLVTILVIFLLEYILSTDSFYKCPLVDHRRYAGLFLLAPCLSFFVLSLFMNTSFWDSITGCCRNKLHYDGTKCRSIMKGISRGAFIAFVWLIIAFANSKFYVCFCLGPKPSTKVLASLTKDQQKLTEIRFSKVEGQSTMIAWSLLLFYCFALLLWFIIQKCCFMNTIESLPSLEKYKKLEAEAARAKFSEQMKILAKQAGEHNVEMLLKVSSDNLQDSYSVLKKAKVWLEEKYPKKKSNSKKFHKNSYLESNERLETGSLQSVAFEDNSV